MLRRQTKRWKIMEEDELSTLPRRKTLRKRFKIVVIRWGQVMVALSTVAYCAVGR